MVDNARMWRLWAIGVVLAGLLLVVGQAGAAPLAQATDTATPTPAVTATPTPAYQTTIALTSGAVVVVDKTWTFGELAIFLMLVVLAALYALHWVYEFTHQGRA